MFPFIGTFSAQYATGTLFYIETSTEKITLLARKRNKKVSKANKTRTLLP